MSVIVVVDDRVTNRNILAQLARAVEPQADVHAFDSARTAYEWMIDKDVDLIITDFQMPEMNGAEFVRECRRKLKCFDVPIIVITAYEDRDYRYSALEAGATDFLRSPIDHHEFRTRAVNLLTMWRQKQIIRQRALSLENELRAATDQHARDLRQGEEKLRHVIDTVPALIRASDADGRCVYLNSYHKTVLAFDAARAIGQPLGILFDEAYGRRHRDLEIQIFETGRILPGFEERLVDRNGNTRQFLTTKAPLCDETGATTLVVTVSLDITERARAEENVRKLSMAVEQSPASVLITNTAGEIEYVNAKFTEVTGYQPAEVIGGGHGDEHLEGHHGVSIGKRHARRAIDAGNRAEAGGVVGVAAPRGGADDVRDRGPAATQDGAHVLGRRGKLVQQQLHDGRVHVGDGDAEARPGHQSSLASGARPPVATMAMRSASPPGAAATRRMQSQP